ncbi:MAG: M20/M25/M40 family metallo-hydrolase [Gaiellales bacterium]
MDTALDLFLALARLPTPPGKERAAIDLVREVLASFGVESEEDDAGPRIDGDAGNLYARIPATCAGTPLFFNAHVDTVPMTAPIDPVIEGDFVVNREPTILGADNKATVAGMIDGIRRIVREGIPHAGIELVITVQEEIGLIGAKAFDVDRLEARVGYVYDVDGDPGAMTMRAPSQITLDLEFRGKSAHAGMEPERGRNAIHAAAIALSRLSMGRVAPGASRSVGLISGGTQRNVVPDRCSVQMEVRSLDDVQVVVLAQEIVDAANAAAAETGCSVEIAQVREYTAYAFSDDDEVVRIARKGLAAAGLDVREIETGGGADAHAFNERGLQCLNLSSGMEAIHTPDERIKVQHVEDLSRMTVELVRAATA